MAGSVKLLIFDLGNVVVRCDHMATYRAWGEAAGTEAEAIAARHPMNPKWERFERGEVSGEEYWQYVREEVGLDLSWNQFETGWNAIYFEVFDEVQQALARLSVPAVALTNTNAIHCRAWQSRYADVLSLFRRVYVSSDMGLRKPESAIYRAVLEGEGVPADEALFFDDNDANVVGARAIGIESVLVESPADVVGTLGARSLLVE